MKTYTKILVAAVMGTYFFGVVYGAVFCFFAGAYLGELLAYIGAPTTAAIGFYCWKAKAENVMKMRAEAAQEEQSDPPAWEEILEELDGQQML